MDRAKQAPTNVVQDVVGKGPPPERQSMRKAIRGIEGFEAQMSALIPPDLLATLGLGKQEDPAAKTGEAEAPKTDEPKGVGPAEETKAEAPKAPKAPRTKTPPTDAKVVEQEVPEVETEEEKAPLADGVPAPAQAEMQQLEASAEQVAKPKTPEKAEDKDKGKEKDKEKDKPKGPTGGARKTKGPKELVETYGTVAEADKHQGRVSVMWVEGLKTEKRGKGKTHKTSEERDDVDSLEPKEQTIPVHEKLVPLFSAIFADIKAAGDWKHLLERPWAHNARQNRNKPTEWSVHSWGTAMDVNPTTNPNAPGAKNYSPSERQKIIAKHFTSRGFTWLKDSDAMHFQYHTGGTPSMTDDEIDAIVADSGKAERNKTFPGTSSESLAANTKSNLKRKEKDLSKVEKLLAAAKAKTPPTNPKKLAKHNKKIAELEKSVQALKWWVGRFQAILEKLKKAPAT